MREAHRQDALDEVLEVIGKGPDKSDLATNEEDGVSDKGGQVDLGVSDGGERDGVTARRKRPPSYLEVADHFGCLESIAAEFGTDRASNLLRLAKMELIHNVAERAGQQKSEVRDFFPI